MSRPARLDPDTTASLVAAITLTALLGAVSFTLSYSGLVKVAAWAAVPDVLAWTVPVTIDASILVYTLAVFIFRARNQPTARAWTPLILFTVTSVAGNAAHAWDASTGDWHGYAGAAIAGLAPVSVLLTTHTLAELIVTPHTAASADRMDDAPQPTPAPAVPQLYLDAARIPPDPAHAGARGGRTRDHLTLVRQLRADGKTVREIAGVVGISKSSVSVLLKEATA